ncbi:MAG TPA: hypothetical protein VGZ02_01225 [Candidatus Baltobacteraceae bacterium]|jgi:hypothetical protein|nr:hypothetical protein [Candidatus Baltobacteraceae bacterium]
MVRDYRAWLQSELRLASGSSEAFARGQADMAQRAIDRFEREAGDDVLLELEPELAAAVKSELETLAQAESLPDSLVSLLQRLQDPEESD